MVVLLGIGYVAIQQFGTKKTDPVEVVESSDGIEKVSPELKKVEDYYLASINAELAKIEYTPETKELFDSYINRLGELTKEYGVSYIVDAMSSFGGIEIDMEGIGCDFLISSANKCIQGVPGFGFVIAKRDAVKGCEGKAKSLSLDLYSHVRLGGRLKPKR